MSVWIYRNNVPNDTWNINAHGTGVTNYQDREFNSKEEAIEFTRNFITKVYRLKRITEYNFELYKVVVPWYIVLLDFIKYGHV